MKTLSQKLGLKDGQTALILNPSVGAVLTELPALAASDREPRLPAYDALLVFAANQADLAAKLNSALPRYKPGGLLWICYPKLSSKLAGDLNRNWLMMAIPGYQPVTNVAIDDDWTALRFRRDEEVGK